MAFARLACFVVSIATLSLTSCGDDSDQVFDRDGFSFTFQYPEGFEETTDISIDQPLGSAPEENVAIALDEHDALLVQRFTLEVQIDEDNLDLARQEIGRLLAQLDPGASLTAGEVAGLPALTADQVTAPSVEGGESRLTFIFDGDQEYLINCQSTPDKRSEIAAACTMALDTLTLN
jgi:hypothetical protein